LQSSHFHTLWRNGRKLHIASVTYWRSMFIERETAKKFLWATDIFRASRTLAIQRLFNNESMKQVAYLADIFSHLNDLNISLQGCGKHSSRGR
jgi:hypothetical protein